MTLLPEEQMSLLQDFVLESLEHLAAVERYLLQLEQTPGEQGLVRAVMRSFHTIKGNSAYLGYRDIAEMAHRLESILSPVQAGGRPPDPALLSELFRGVDQLKAKVRYLAMALGEGMAGQADEEKGDTSRYLVFRAGDTHMALPIDQVLEVTRPLPVTRLPHVPEYIAGLVNLRGTIVPLVDLEHKLWGQPCPAIQHLVVVPWQKGRVALGVRQVLHVSTLDVAGPIDQGPVAGTRAVLRQGKAVLVLELASILAGP